MTHAHNLVSMKIALTIILFSFSLGVCLSQNISYAIKATDIRGVSKQKLSQARTLNDIRPGYASPMMEGYTSTEVSVTTNGKVSKAVGSNATLTAGQQSLLRMADIGSNISIEIGYIDQHPVTLFPDVQHIEYEVEVMSGVEASFPGGYQDLSSYLEKKAMNIITERISNIRQGAVIHFTINESGNVVKARVAQSSTIPEMDSILLNVINNMPQWHPAKNAEGKEIPQEFELIVGNGC